MVKRGASFSIAFLRYFVHSHNQIDRCEVESYLNPGYTTVLHTASAPRSSCSVTELRFSPFMDYLITWDTGNPTLLHQNPSKNTALLIDLILKIPPVISEICFKIKISIFKSAIRHFKIHRARFWENSKFWALM